MRAAPLICVCRVCVCLRTSLVFPTTISSGGVYPLCFCSFIGVFLFIFISCGVYSVIRRNTQKVFLFNSVEVKLREFEICGDGDGEKKRREKHNVAAHNKHNYYQQNKEWLRQTKSARKINNYATIGNG